MINPQVDEGHTGTDTLDSKHFNDEKISMMMDLMTVKMCQVSMNSPSTQTYNNTLTKTRSHFRIRTTPKPNQRVPTSLSM